MCEITLTVTECKAFQVIFNQFIYMWECLLSVQNIWTLVKQKVWRNHFVGDLVQMCLPRHSHLQASLPTHNTTTVSHTAPHCTTLHHTAQYYHSEPHCTTLHNTTTPHHTTLYYTAQCQSFKLHTLTEHITLPCTVLQCHQIYCIASKHHTDVHCSWFYYTAMKTLPCSKEQLCVQSVSWYLCSSLCYLHWSDCDMYKPGNRI